MYSVSLLTDAWNDLCEGGNAVHFLENFNSGYSFMTSKWSNLVGMSFVHELTDMLHDYGPLGRHTRATMFRACSVTICRSRHHGSC